jgi:hypothetical protein
MVNLEGAGEDHEQAARILDYLWTGIGEGEEAWRAPRENEVRAAWSKTVATQQWPGTKPPPAEGAPFDQTARRRQSRE